jgi:hypothetical protein
MNKAYVDRLDPEADTKAVLVHIKGDATLTKNLLSTKFPDGYCDETQVWSEGYNSLNGNKIVVWFPTGVYHYETLIEDLEFMDYNVLELAETFDRFEQMLRHIEENNL